MKEPPGNSEHEPAPDREAPKAPALKGGSSLSNPDDGQADGLFHFVDKAASFLLVFGLGYLALRHASSGFGIAMGLVIAGGVVKVILRAL